VVEKHSEESETLTGFLKSILIIQIRVDSIITQNGETFLQSFTAWLYW